MTREEIDALAQRIDQLGDGVNLESFLGALGQVVTHVLRQYPIPEERMAATVSWVAVLTNQMLHDYKQRKAN